MDALRINPGGSRRFLLPLVATACVLLCTAASYASKASKPQREIRAEFSIPDSIVAGQPFNMKFEFEVLDSVPWNAEYPDYANVWFSKGYSILNGSTEWEGRLQRGSVVAIEFTAVYPEDAVRREVIFSAHIYTGMESRGKEGPVPYTDNHVRSDIIELIGREPTDPIDTMTLNGEPMPEKMREGIEEMRRGPVRPEITGCLSLLDAKPTDDPDIYSLGEFRVSETTKTRPLCFCTDDKCVQRSPVMSWKCRSGEAQLEETGNNA